MELESVHITLEKDVVQSYWNTMEALDFETAVAPDLEEIYNDFYETMIDNIEVYYEEIFGQGASITNKRLSDIGLSMDEIPSVYVVCKVLNSFKLGYMYKGRLYNIAPQPLILAAGGIFE